MSDFLPRTLWYLNRELKQERVTQGEVLELADSIVILGEPGMGKTRLLEVFASASEAASCTARQLINRHDPRSLLGKAQLLVIDALDEVAAAGQGDAIDLVLQKLGAMGYPRFVISCRAADWRAATAVEAIREQYITPPLELHLDPLERHQQQALLVRLTGDEARAGALLDHFDKYQLDFLGNPQTLKLIADLPRDQDLPRTSSRLLELAVEELRREHKSGKLALPALNALNAAGAAFATLVLTGSSRIARKTAVANFDDGELPFAEVGAIAGDSLDRVIGTRLFSVSAQGYTYSHRRVGEFLAARWLARSADTRSKRKRLLAMLRSEGRVPANLRGLHAWLALDINLVSDVIAADPMGVIEYGDGDVLSPTHAKLLLDSLERISHGNPRFAGWNEYRASALVATPLQNEAREVIADRGRAFGLRRLLIDQLNCENLTQEMRSVLLTLLRDPDEIFAIREAAGNVLAKVGGIDWPTELDAIRHQASRMSMQLAVKMMDDIGVQAFSDTQIVETVFACDGLSLCPVLKDEFDQSVGVYRNVARHTPIERLEGLLDLFSDYAKALLPPHVGIDEHQLLDLYYELILKRLENGAPEAQRLWSWLEPLGRQSSYRRLRGRQLAEWFRTNDLTRRAVQCVRMLPERDPTAFRMRAFELSDVSAGLSISSDDAIILLSLLDPTNRRDERWREILRFVRTSGDEGKLLRDAAKYFANHRVDLLEWIDSLADPPEQKWQRKQSQEDRKRRAKRAVAYAQHRRNFLENLASIRRGDFHFIVNLAKAYLNQYRDLDDDQPAHKRIAAWVGDDVATAAHEGFERFLQLIPPHPSAARIAVSRAKGTHWRAADIIVAALAERLRTREAPFAGVSSERLMAGLFEIWRSRIDHHAKIEGLQDALEAELDARGDLECALRLYIEPQLKKRNSHVDQLYALMRSQKYRGDLPLRMAEDWLRRFPDLPAEPESELLDVLLAMGRGNALVSLISDRFSRPLDTERRRNWAAVQLLVDFQVGRRSLEQKKVESELIWHLRKYSGYHRRDNSSPAILSPQQIEWIVASFRLIFPSHAHPPGGWSGDTNPWDASDYIRSLAVRLSRDLSDEAIVALGRLCDEPADGYTDAFKIYAAEQAQARAEHHYVPPTLAEINAVVEGGPPTTAADLHAVLLEALDEVQARLKGDPLDWYLNFFREDGGHKDEELCRDALLQMLDGKLPGVELRPEDHSADDKRVDIVAQIGPGAIVPIEIKGQWHPKLWTAADLQLEHLYVNDWRAERGIYLVLWFGKGAKLQSAPKGMPTPSTPEELKAGLEATSNAAARGRIDVVIVDLERPILQ